TGVARPYVMPAGGRGYTRPPSLASLWSTAPYLLNNTVGPFSPNPSVETRVKSFEISIKQMLWPETRKMDAIFPVRDPGAGTIDRTTTRSYLKVPVGYLPDEFKKLRSLLHRVAPALFTAAGSVQIGPIPKDTPVGLISNLQILSETDDRAAQAAH